jgi:multidrug efflux pump subunit AcrA (membrane-fusion protein)
MNPKFSFLLASGLLMAFIVSCDQTDPNANENEAKVPVEVTTVRLGNLAQTLNYHGDIKAEYEVKVYSKVPDRIEQFFVDAGDDVAKGAPVAKIAAATIEQAVRQAEAALVAAKANEANLRSELERVKYLYQDTSVSKQQYDAVATQYEAAQAQVEQAEAALTSAKSQLYDATIKERS